MSDIDDWEYLRLAYKQGLKSKDSSTQNGAVIVDPRSGLVIAWGHNDLHGAVRDTPERRERPRKYSWTEHAERAAIYHAARLGISTEGMWLYCPWFACADCGRAILYSGIKRVIGHTIPQHKGQPGWAETIEAAEIMFQEAGVEVVRLEGTVGITFRFAGEMISV